MSGTLRVRIALLPALVALMTMTGCLVAGLQVIDAALSRNEQLAGLDAWGGFAATIRRCQAGIAYEAGDYGRWDELAERMPRPPDDWSAINLSPTVKAGSFTASMAVVAGGRVQGRYRAGFQGGAEATVDDPIPAEALIRLAESRQPVFGAVAGRVVLCSAQDITASDGSGPVKGRLLAYRYLDDELQGFLAPAGWSLDLVATPPATERDPAVLVEGEKVTVRGLIHGGDGSLAITLRQLGGESHSLRSSTALAMVTVGGASAVLAAVLGALLGWRWLRPLRVLAEWCRGHPALPRPPLPPTAEFEETRVLADGIASFMEAEKRMQEHHRLAHDRTRIAYAVHQRFIARLGDQVGDPLRTLGRGLAQLRSGGAADPSLAESMENAFRTVEERLSDALAVGAGATTETSLVLPVRLRAWLDGIAQRFSERTSRQGVAIAVAAPDLAILIDDGELAPVLIHLLSNACAASPAGSTVDLSATPGADRLVLRIADHGPGFPEGLAERVRVAMARGEVLPGEPGIGFGLSMAIDRVARLGGTIRLEGSEATGSVVAVEVPMRKWQERG